MKTLIAFAIFINTVACAHMSQDQRESVYKDLEPVTVTASDSAGGSCHLNTECSKGFMCMKRSNSYSGVCINVQKEDGSFADN